MRNALSTAFLAATVLLVSFGASAQRACPEGRTSTGQCVNPALADSMRQAGIIYSQPKLSFTHYPVLPALDWTFRYPNQVNPDPSKPSSVGVSGE